MARTHRPGPIIAYWLDHYVDPRTHLCTLCGNSGYVDTRFTAVSAAGVMSGRVDCCICPNGMAHRKHNRTAK